MRMFGPLYIVSNALMTAVMGFLLLVIFTAPIIFHEKAAYVEGRNLPVIENFEIIKATQFQPGESTVIYVNFDKLRECKFVRSAFTKRDITGRLVDVDITYLEDKGGSPDSKPMGSYTAGPWLINVPIEELHTLVSYRTRHICHMGWDTITKEEVHGGIDPRAARPRDIRSDWFNPRHESLNRIIAAAREEDYRRARADLLGAGAREADLQAPYTGAREEALLPTYVRSE